MIPPAETDDHFVWALGKKKKYSRPRPLVYHIVVAARSDKVLPIVE